MNLLIALNHMMYVHGKGSRTTKDILEDVLMSFVLGQDSFQPLTLLHQLAPFTR